MNFELIKEWWPIFFAIVGVVIWAVRVEAGMKQNASDITALWRQRNEDIEAHKRAREETNDMLKKLDGKMDAAFSEFRSDIKALLRQGGE